MRCGDCNLRLRGEFRRNRVRVPPAIFARAIARRIFRGRIQAPGLR